MQNSIARAGKSKAPLEKIMNVLFLVCGLAAVVSVVLISLYMVLSGAPAIAKIGPLQFLAGQIWNPEAKEFGILPLILSSVTATGLAVVVAVPAALCVAVFLTQIAGKRLASALLFLVELLAGIPSVVYGLLGAILIVPLVFQAQTALGLPMSGSLLSASIVLVIMILPTIISVSVSSIHAVPRQYNDVSLALGSSKMQSIVRAVIPAAKSGIVSGIVLGVGRAIGETMAVMMVAGNAPIMPEFLKPARLLTVGISMEWAYSSGIHREALFGIGLVLFAFIMVINVLLSTILKKGGARK
ncbi:MAG: phosphate ABC transporter permease subunit PstC [Oscillospiraceae bacterium]|jgi:phosphate transport system permease protein|nr:phosphate ABC transporter permease subunit PstC [Oscillospiraceae bacterium]